MGEKFRRSLFFNINKYQLRTILPVMVSLIFLFTITGLSYYWVMYLDRSLQGTHQLFFLKGIAPIALIVLSLLVLLYVYWIYFITNRILGPFERIVRELDEMIDNKREWHRLKTRDGDDMFNQLIRRINVLIDQI